MQFIIFFITLYKMYFFKKSQVVPIDETHPSIPDQLKTIDNFLIHLQSFDTIMFKNIIKKQKNVIPDNVLQVKLEAIAPFW